MTDNSEDRGGQKASVLDTIVGGKPVESEVPVQMSSDVAQKENDVPLTEEQKLIAFSKELDKISVTMPVLKMQKVLDIVDKEQFPQTYKENTRKEKLVLGYAENFRRQYVHLYRDRKPLFLNPYNECFVEKFVCTSIRPSQLPYQELYDWDGAAEFVADYLEFAALDPPYELPTKLFSSPTVLKNQKGHCFEHSTLLCSLLIGSGYDAYVVSGYATRETCLKDETREICPLLRKKEEEKVDPVPEIAVQKAEEAKVDETKPSLKKYSVKPPKDLRSKYELKMEARRKKEEAEEEAKRKEKEEAELAEREKPPPDPLHGLRVHSWVLVLEGKREVAESFFIEPLTGNAHPITSDNFLGIESLWNHQNYWVNMQDCSEGVKKLRYDLGDCTMWEFIFLTNDNPRLHIPDEDDLNMLGFDDDEDDEDCEKNLDMPPSWISPISVSLRDFELRCPSGKKTKLYKRAKLEKFAHYLMKDGLVCRLSVFEDKECLNQVETKEYFEHRTDKLREKSLNHQSGWVIEHYKPGRQRSLKEHHYKVSAPGPENERTMTFYHEARVDGLERRVETPTEITETFIKRQDFLHHRHVEFGKRAKKFGPAENSSHRPIVKMVEKYHRNPAKPAHEDRSEIIFMVGDDKILVTYHTEDTKISASTREFVKPSNAEEKGAMLIMTPDMHSTFQVDPDARPKKQVELYQLLAELIRAEDVCRDKVRDSELEVQKILNERTREEAASETEISVYDTMRNEKAKRHRKEMEKQQQEEKMRKQEMELDYLAPFLAQIGVPDKLTRQQAFRLKEDCLADLKQRLIDKANLIQARFEKETQELQKKQTWYQQNQVSMSKEDEEEYLSYCSEAMFRINILELRLNRHKELAPHKYMELEKKLRADPRLSEFL